MVGGYFKNNQGLKMIFKEWFVLKSLSAGDWPYLFPENIAEFSFFPQWPFLWLTPFYQLTAKIFVQYLGFSWELTEKIVWFWPFLFLTIFSSWYLVKTIFKKASFLLFTFYFLLYGFNTYILMVVGGGQMGVAMAYSLAPLVLGRFMRKNLKPQTSSLKPLMFTGVVLAIQIMFDPRIAFTTVLVVLVYWFINRLERLKLLIIPVFLAFFLNSYWILPTIRFGVPTQLESYRESGWMNYLSIAKFSDGISLLHPNWPENIFGKTYFMKPEFIILPILAFSSLLFLKSLITNYQLLITYFALLALIGAFLAKGVNPPLGIINRWLFQIPGFNLFRDPTKFYLLVCLSYSVLVPFSIYKIYSLLKSKVKYLFLLFALGYLLFLIKPLILGQLGGTFRAKEVPQEYIALKDFLIKDQSSGRVLWLPTKQRFGFSSNNHPAINSEDYLTDFICKEPFCSLKMEMPSKWGEKCFPNDRCYVRELSYFLNPKTAEIMAQMGIKYIVVPFDSEKEIFIAEWKYNPQQREEVEEFLDTIPWLKKIEVADKIAMYEVR